MKHSFAFSSFFQKLRLGFTLTTTVFALLIAISSTAAAESSEDWNYEARFTAEGFKASGKSGTYAQDPHVWVYTSAFAKRFRMPDKWIDDSLKGADALAYRVDRTYYKPR